MLIDIIYLGGVLGLDLIKIMTGIQSIQLTIRVQSK